MKLCLKRGFRVILASEPSIIYLIQREIPSIETDYFPGAKISYSAGKTQVWKLIRLLPKGIYWYFKEKQITARLVKKYNPLAIISDNRYGCYNKKVKSILITHQLMLKMPKGFSWFEKPFHWLIKTLISRFEYCWVPDNAMPYSLAGDLVHKYKLPKNSILVGPLSRFMSFDNDTSSNIKETKIDKKDLLVLLSGPEPHRSILHNKLLKKTSVEKMSSVFITGKPGIIDRYLMHENGIAEYSHANTTKLKQFIESSENIICRSGYTSIMDLWYIGKAAILIPTPGQTEQEYLAGYHNGKNHYTLSQFDLDKTSLPKIIAAYNPLKATQKKMQPLFNSLINAVDSI